MTGFIPQGFKRSFCIAMTFAGLCVGLSTNAVAQVSRDEYVDVNGSRLHVKLMGEQFRSDDSITVVLDAGGGADSTQWATLQPMLVDELKTVVVSYDRFGFGESDLPETPYDIRNEVAALHTALAELGLSDRVILVGHSFAGLTIHNYAVQWPEEVKGLLFLDPNTAGAMIALKQMLFAQPPNPDPQTKREHALERVNSSLMDTMTLTYQNPLPPQTRIIVISAENGLFPTDRLDLAFKLSHQLLAASVENGKHVLATGSGHNIPGDRADLVIASVRELME